MNKKNVKLLQGDNMVMLKTLPDNSIDSIVTDPPYGINFMGKKWDYQVPTKEFWIEVMRVLKPGGHILSFCGTRTYHRMVVNIEDAGFEIRDCISWLYGSGFPKSHNVGKAVDKIEGNEREVVGENPNHRIETDYESQIGLLGGHPHKGDGKLTKGTSEYEGWGSALKPSQELICMARKPLSEPTIAANILKWGTGGINIDGCRIGNEPKPVFNKENQVSGNTFNVGSNRTGKYSTEGRFPANIIFECICDEVIKGEKGDIKKRDKLNNHNGQSIFNTNIKGSENYDYTDKGDIHTNPDCPCYILDEQSGTSKSTKANLPVPKISGNGLFENIENTGVYTERGHNDKGGASRFFYVAKVSKKERNMGLDDFEDKNTNIFGTISGKITGNPAEPKKNNHPTVKPINLLTYLCRLITPKDGTILDPFMGSGSTGIAAQLEGFRFVGMELEKEYFKIAEKRIAEWEQYKKLLKK